MTDINSYSYINYKGKSTIIASADVGYGFPSIEFTAERNWFGDEYYFVCDIMGDFAEEYPMNEKGRKEAMEAYNKLVAEQKERY